MTATDSLQKRLASLESRSAGLSTGLREWRLGTSADLDLSARVDFDCIDELALLLESSFHYCRDVACSVLLPLGFNIAPASPVELQFDCGLLFVKGFD